jgi:hypothetical protein
MALKRKKALTPEELREKLNTEKAPFWHNGEPYFSVIQTPQGLELFSLQEIFGKEVIALFLLDVADYTTERVMDVLDLWKARYKGLGWKPILVFQQKYLFLKNPKFFDRYKNHSAFLSTPIYLDIFGETHEWANSAQQPCLLLLTQGKIFYKDSLNGPFAQKILAAETRLQEALRIEDAGLPLPILSLDPQPLLLDTQTIRIDQVTLNGNWIEGKGSLLTEDSQSTLTFPFEGNSLRLAIDLHPQSRENARIQITLNEQPVKESNFGPALRNDEKGNSILEVNEKSGIYDLFVSPEKLRGIFKLHFCSPHPIIFYELRVGSV